MNKKLVPFLGIFCLGASECSTPVVQPDSSAYAIESNDPTVIIWGCGSQPVTGFTYCRKREGQTTNEGISFVVPPLECGEDVCAELKIFFPDGSPTLSYLIPKCVDQEGKPCGTRKTVSWKEIVKNDTFQRDQRGFWPIIMKFKWIGPDERQHETVIEGEIRLRVLGQSYVPLHEVREDINFVWKWKDYAGHEFRMTTAGRASTWQSQ